MQVTLKFNPKSTARDVKKAITLSEKLNSYKLNGDEKVVSITQDVASIHKNFIAVLNIVSGLSKTQILIDEELVEETYYVRDLLTCVKKSYCDGICSLETGIFYNLFRQLGVIKDKSYFQGFQTWDLEKLNVEVPEIFNLLRPDYVEINRDKLIDAYIESCGSIYKVCSAFSIDATVNQLKNLPGIITVKVLDRMVFDDDDELDDESSSNANGHEDNSNNQEGVLVTISNQQVNDIAVKIADEVEARLRKLISEFK